MSIVVKKIIASIILFLVFHDGFAETFYISPEGNDSSGNGSKINPWRSLYKATSAVTRPGDIIHVLAGIFKEKSSCYLAAGVSLEGEGKTSILQSTFNDEWIPILSVRSEEGTNGRQHISGLTFDGQNLFTSWAIIVAGRSNVSIHHCYIKDFRDRGVIFSGRTDNEELPPTQYSKGNSFHDNTLTNCAAYNINGNIYGRGGLNIGGQDSMLIYNNIITQDGRPDGYNGFPIKYTNNGYLKGIKLYHNTITKKPFAGKYGGDNGWDFAIELWNVEGGVEIFDNVIQGATDIVISKKGKYPYGVWFHDNAVSQKKVSKFYESGIIFEFSNEGVIIENNVFTNISGGVLFYAQKNSVLTNIQVHKNIFKNLGREDGPGNNSKGILFDYGDVKKGETPFVARDISITGNKFFPAKNLEPMFGIEITGHKKINNLEIRENSFSNFSTACISIDPAGAVDSLYFTGNLLKGNGNNNDPLFMNGRPVNYINERNTADKSNVGSAVSFSLKNKSLVRSLYYELRQMNNMLILSMFLLVPAFLFTIFFNSLGFLFGIVSLTMMTTIFSEQKLYGMSAVCIFLIIINAYGWQLWKEKSEAFVPLLSKKTWIPASLLLLISFGLFYTIHLNASAYFSAGYRSTTDSLAIALSISSLWLTVKKQPWSWILWMVAAVVSGSGFVSKGYLVPAFFTVFIFLAAALGLFLWNSTKSPFKPST